MGPVTLKRWWDSSALDDWSMFSEAAGHRWLLGFPPAFQLALGAASSTVA